jgi:hypothetical protein
MSEDVRIHLRSTADTRGADKLTGSLRNTQHALGRMQSTSKKAAKETKALSSKSNQAGQAMLVWAQGIEDAQYGLRGITNNIPLMITSLGGPAGLAAVLSITAVAAGILGEKLLDS